jgi:hypothetical protein
MSLLIAWSVGVHDSLGFALPLLHELLGLALIGDSQA